MGDGLVRLIGGLVLAALVVLVFAMLMGLG